MSAVLEAERYLDDAVPATPMYRVTIDHPAAWTVADFKTPADYTLELTPAQLADIAQAMRQIK
jgi:hypothetical protein